MKQNILFLALLCISTSIFAQYDNKFYKPQKNCYPIDSLLCEITTELINGDSIFVIKTIPSKPLKATVFFYHGNSGNLTYAANQTFMRLLTDAGYQIFAFDYPGFGHSTGTPTHVNIAEAATYLFQQWVKEEKINEKPIIIYGSSIGAQIATTLAADNETRIKSLVLDGCSPSFAALAEQFSPEEYRPYIKQFVVSPYSVEQAIGKLQEINILFIHSKTDPIAYEGAEAMYKAVNSPKYFWTYVGDHLEVSSLYPREFIEQMDKLY